MIPCFTPAQQDIQPISLNRFPPFLPVTRMAIADQIARHLERMLGSNPSGMVGKLQIPSAMTLALFYHCSALDVLDGLYRLKAHRYDYAMNGLDSPIMVYGPDTEYKPARLMPDWLYPWEQPHRVTESPLERIFQPRLLKPGTLPATNTDSATL